MARFCLGVPATLPANPTNTQKTNTQPMDATPVNVFTISPSFSWQQACAMHNCSQMLALSRTKCHGWPCVLVGNFKFQHSVSTNDGIAPKHSMTVVTLPEKPVLAH